MLTADSGPGSRAAELTAGTGAVNSSQYSAALGVDDWSFGPVESALGPVAGVVALPWRFSSEAFMAMSSTVPIKARLAAPAIDSAVVNFAVTICRFDVGLTRYRYRLGPQFRLRIDAELSRAGTDGRW